MLTNNNYAELHIYCGNAIEVYEDGTKSIQDPIEFLAFQTKWLIDYKYLFCFIILKPKNTAGICVPHPEHFFNIRKFYKLYESINDGITTDEEMENYYSRNKN